MRKFTLIIALCSIAITLSGQTRNISLDDAKINADRNATSIDEDVYPT